MTPDQLQDSLEMLGFVPPVTTEAVKLVGAEPAAATSIFETLNNPTAKQDHVAALAAVRRLAILYEVAQVVS